MKAIFLSIIFTFCIHALISQPSQEVITSLKFRNIGPAFMTGRIADIAKDHSDPSTWYVATASSNVWKTTNSGTTWTPIFDHEGSYSTGCITIDPINPNVIWLGTGENQSQRSVGWGDGVYKSLDGGKTWKNMGLKSSEHIGKIVIDPRNSDIVIVAAQGPLWKQGGERGIYRTEDGGENWTQVLEISENTGASEIVMDPSNPDILYASTYQRRRHVGILVAGGPESRVYKSTNNGASWKKISKGLPSGDVGRIALAISPQRHNVVYAQLVGEGVSSGFYRSEDYGESWKKTSDYTIVDPQYYGEIYCDPHKYDHVYVMDMMIHHTTDGGKTFNRLNSRNKHVDNHSLLFDPEDPDYLMVGCDGGIYESWDQGATWKFHDNLPIVQFYRVGIDNDFPFYNVYGGTQDNSTIFAPSQTNTLHGITNAEWKLALGGDGFQARIDPEDPNTVYCQSQYAGIVRYDRSTGQRTELQPQVSVDEDPLRWHWDSPIIISRHHSKRLYYAAQKVFRSDDRGDTWKAISEDLSRGENRNNREVMGKIWQPEAVWKNVFTSPYGTIVSLNESPIIEGLIVAGTDDGQLQITEDGGGTWRVVNNFPGVPDRSYIADVITSAHDQNVIYVVFNNHKEGDFSPYILKSNDLGKSWTSIVGGIKDNHTCWTIVEDHATSGLLFAGTEFGLYCSFDGGNNWTMMKGGLPIIPVRDLEIQIRENDLVLATFGRGMWILDDYSTLRHMSAMDVESSHIFPIKDSWTFFTKGDKGYRKKGVFGDNFYVADNPPQGPVVRIYLNEKFTSLSSKRKKESKVYPTYDELKKEDTQVSEEYFLLVKTDKGEIVRRQKVRNAKGFQQINLDMSRKHLSEDGKIERSGPRPLNGSFRVQLCKASAEEIIHLTPEVTFKIKYLPFSEESPSLDYFEFYTEVTEMVVKLRKIDQMVEERLTANEKMRDKAILKSDKEQLTALELQRLELLKMKEIIRGDETLIKRAEYHHRGLLRKLNGIYWNMWQSSQITSTHRATVNEAKREITRLSSITFLDK